jgi:hypothetical protein
MPDNTTSMRTVHTWTCRRTHREFLLARRGRLWLVGWASDDGDWSIAGGSSISEAFRNNGHRRIPAGFSYHGSGCTRRRTNRRATYA